MKAQIMYENDEFLFITWEKDSNANRYYVSGMDNNFNYEIIKTLDTNSALLKKEDIKQYLNIRINYIFYDEKINQDILVNQSNEIYMNKRELDNITVLFLESFDGMTMSFQSKDIYDKYLIYEKNGNDYTLIIQTEDFQITSKAIVKNNHYFVEGYRKENDEYILCAKSQKISCNPIKHVIPKKQAISIVVPIYNSELFLCRCVDSILLSALKDIEIILVDDGSTDNSPNIVDWYHEQYKDIVKVIHKKNQGLSFARNDGIKIATGEYIAFLDSDDLVHPFMYENLYTEAIENNLDITIGKAIIRKNIGEYIVCLDVKTGFENTVIYSYDQMFFNHIRNNFENIYFVAVWNKIIKSSIVKQHPFPLENYYEDTAFTRMIYSYINKFGFVKNAYYIWDKRQRQTKGTLSTTYKNGKNQLINQKYCDAVFYAVETGNTNRIDYIIYDSIKETVDYLKSRKILDTKTEISKIYIDKIKSINEKYNIFQNKLILNDQKLLADLKNYIIIK